MVSDCLDITNSCFVFAAAGSGKTNVLINRYVKSLMFGINAREILCLTFTKAAAIEMESRILSVLEKLYLNENNFAENYLSNVIGMTSINHADLAVSGQLFFDFQNDLHNIKIMTLHSFCQNLLSKFPLEAGLRANFEVLDENDAEDLMKKAKRTALESLWKTDPEPLRSLAGLVSGYTFEDLVDKILSSPARLINFFESNKDDYEQKLESFFNLGKISELSEEFNDYISEFFPDKNLEEVLLTNTGNIRKRLSDTEDKIARIVYKNSIFRKKNILIRKIVSFLKIIRIIFDEYQNLKRKNNVIDFDEILYTTDYLFTQSYAKEFVMSKFYESVKCIMIDEAQDLSQLQWKIVSIFSEDILMNHKSNKTMFVVGDIKQSIYRFQGADCKSFPRFYEVCKKSLSSIGKDLKTVHLNTSYRSLPKILTVVDAVFKDCDFLADGGDGPLRHVAHRQDDDGVVEFIELSGDESVDQAKQISDFICKLPASEILLLTRSRNEMSELVMRELSRSGLKIASPDCLDFTQNLLIMDIISLVNFCINYDRYSLCCILKSAYIFEYPLSDDDLFYICDDGNILDNLRERYDDKWRIISRIIKCYESYSFINFFYFILNDIIRSFGQEDEFAISAFMDTIISFSKKKSDVPSEFLDYFNETLIRVSMQNLQNDGVRLSTIHGAKGLEAPVVCLLDFKLKADKTKTKMVWYNDLFFLKPTKNDSFEEIDSVLDYEYEEERRELFRLLYVAMTRSRDKLYIFGKKDGDLWKIFNPIIGYI
ncbi:MAG: UvrD-helicase domain-containing protein [Holosporales bacterium]|jgi:ATP-dependent helicase/nuclease subunit A|nr:UvrD-helicase domain-containing protein [Holosporales bacterium]